MNQKKYILTFVLLFVVFCEILSRGFLVAIFNQNFFNLNVYQYFYPELERLKSYEYNKDKVNVLILGGSVVSDEKFEVNVNNQNIPVSFCNFYNLLDTTNIFNLVSLAKSGHNTLDSYIKFLQCSKQKFDYVFVYHGINDLRANNIDYKLFDKEYRHIEFYDDISVVERHPELKYFSVPFLVHWTIHSIEKRSKFYIPKEIFRGLLNGEPESYVNEGNDLKSKESFKNNLEMIIDLAAKKNEKVVLTTYANYVPNNYTYKKFTNKELDYGQQIFPVELYGIPENIRLGLIAHNEIICSFSNKENVLFFDFNSNLNKSKENFDDVCHLTKNGCELLAIYLQSLVQKHPS